MTMLEWLVISSTRTCMVTPSMMSPYSTIPPTSLTIGRV
jgi:hypothetical protein